MLFGTDGDDTLKNPEASGESKSVYVGGRGDDVLEGSRGRNTYIWNLGDGNDVIRMSSYDNELKFGEGILPGDVIVSQSGAADPSGWDEGGRDLCLIVERTGERITLENETYCRRLSRIVFADGTAWTWDDIYAMNAYTDIFVPKAWKIL